MAITRQHTRRLDRDVSPIVSHRRSSARAGIQIGTGGLAFFVVYITLQLLHAFGNDPRIVEALGSIPLFSRLVACTACALIAGLSIGFLVRDPTRLLRRLPALLATAVALFIVAVVFFS